MFSNNFRKSLIRGRPPEAEPEIEEVDTPSSCSGEGLEEAEMGGNADQGNDSGQTKSNIFFFTRYASSFYKTLSKLLLP